MVADGGVRRGLGDLGHLSASLDNLSSEASASRYRPQPLEEPLPIRRERTDAAVRTVRGDEQRVEPKKLRNFRLVVRQVLVERRARGHAGLLQLDQAANLRKLLP